MSLKDIADNWDEKHPAEKLFYESLYKSDLGEWTMKAYYRAKHEANEYFDFETVEIPVGVSRGRIQYKERTIMILKGSGKIPHGKYRMTMDNFDELATEYAKHGLDVIHCIIPKLIEHWDRVWSDNKNQLEIQFQ